MFDLLCCREIPPVDRKVGHTRHIGKRDYAAVFETYAVLACSFERRACHRPGMWLALGARATEHPSRARA